MPEYRRFVAYFYEYIDGKKEKNAGFAKVELRNGMWRILFRLTAARHPEPPVQVYGFVREQGYLLGLPMGTMRPGNEMMEEWAYRAEQPIWEGKYRLEDLAGIWITSGGGDCYITVWDDESVQTGRFVLELPGAGFREEGSTALGGEAPKIREEGSAALGREAPKIREEGSVVLGGDSPQFQVEGKEIPSGEASRAGKSAEPGGEASGAGKSAEPGGEASGAEKSAGLGEDVPPAEGGTAPGGEAPRAVGGLVSREGEMPSAKGGSLPPMAVVPGRMRQREGAAVLPGGKDTTMGKAEDTAGAPSFQQQEIREESRAAAAWRELCARRTPCQPFPEKEFAACIRILPCDLRLLQRAGCQVGRSNFLLHGFYQYRHLLLAEAREGEYVLGVPGIRNSQEQYMAQMFGFPTFLPASGGGGSQKFGYWCRSLS